MYAPFVIAQTYRSWNLRQTCSLRAKDVQDVVRSVQVRPPYSATDGFDILDETSGRERVEGERALDGGSGSREGRQSR